MKVAHIFSTSGHTASYKLGKMILPQVEAGGHGAEVVGLFFFDDNTFVLRAGERLATVVAEQARLKSGWSRLGHTPGGPRSYTSQG